MAKDSPLVHAWDVFGFISLVAIVLAAICGLLALVALGLYLALWQAFTQQPWFYVPLEVLGIAAVIAAYDQYERSFGCAVAIIKPHPGPIWPERGSPAWVSAWENLGLSLRDSGLGDGTDLDQFGEDGSEWRYLGGTRIASGIKHQFSHRNHPRTHRVEHLEVYGPLLSGSVTTSTTIGETNA